MKVRNGWKAKNKLWDKFAIKLRLGAIDFLIIEVDISREFYMLTILNFALKNQKLGYQNIVASFYFEGKKAINY